VGGGQQLQPQLSRASSTRSGGGGSGLQPAGAPAAALHASGGGAQFAKAAAPPPPAGRKPLARAANLGHQHQAAGIGLDTDEEDEVDRDGARSGHSGYDDRSGAPPQRGGLQRGALGVDSYAARRSDSINSSAGGAAYGSAFAQHQPGAPRIQRAQVRRSAASCRVKA
jgi:hypothetical protein